MEREREKKNKPQKQKKTKQNKLELQTGGENSLLTKNSPLNMYVRTCVHLVVYPLKYALIKTGCGRLPVNNKFGRSKPRATGDGSISPF